MKAAVVLYSRLESVSGATTQLVSKGPWWRVGRKACASHATSPPGANRSTSTVSRPPVPPFDEETARLKVQMAEDAWNSRDPHRVSLAYTEDSEWRNRAEFIKGRDAIEDFLKRKWARELDYKLRKYLWAFRDNRISVCFEYEYRDASGQWYRSYGNENWEFSEEGLMRKRIASINEAPIQAHERRIAVDNAQERLANTWLRDQGLSQQQGKEFPLSGGSVKCY